MMLSILPTRFITRQYKTIPIAQNERNIVVNGQVTGVNSYNNNLTYKLHNQSEHGSVSIVTDGNWTYTPAQDYTGNDSFTVEVCESRCGTVIPTIYLTVIDVLVSYNITLNATPSTIVENGIDKTILTAIITIQFRNRSGLY